MSQKGNRLKFLERDVTVLGQPADIWIVNETDDPGLFKVKKVRSDDELFLAADEVEALPGTVIKLKRTQRQGFVAIGNDAGEDA